MLSICDIEVFVENLRKVREQAKTEKKHFLLNLKFKKKIILLGKNE